LTKSMAVVRKKEDIVGSRECQKSCRESETLLSGTLKTGPGAKRERDCPKSHA